MRNDQGKLLRTKHAHILGIWLAIFLHSSFAQRCMGQVVTYDFSATVTGQSSNGTIFGVPAPNNGDSISGTFSYDLSVPPSHSESGFSSYEFGYSNGSSISFSGTSFSSASHDVSISDNDEDEGDNFSFLGRFQNGDHILLDLSDSTQSVFSNALLPTSYLTAPAFDEMNGLAKSDTGVFSFDVNNINRVQKVFLAFGSETPWGYKDSLIPGNVTFDGNRSLVADVGFSQSDIQQIEASVNNIFTDAGINHVDVVALNGSAPPVLNDNETVVYFSSDEVSVGLYGDADPHLFGIDRENSELGKAVIFSEVIRHQTGSSRSMFLNNVSKAVTHEIGHTFGLFHIDPTIDTEVMDENLFMSEADQVRFFGAPAQIDDNFFYSNFQQNSVYNIRRFVQGESVEKLNGEGLIAGSWDAEDFTSTLLNSAFEGFETDTNLMLDHVELLVKNGGLGNYTLSTFWKDDGILVEDLSSLVFQLQEGTEFTIVGLSGDDLVFLSLDETFSSQDPFVTLTGDQQAFLVREVNGEYQQIASFMLLTTAVPEPNMVCLLLASGVAAILRRRRKDCQSQQLPLT